MKCPFCGSNNGKVLDTRQSEEGFAIRRRRECLDCSKRFTTHEVVEDLPIIVIKKDGAKQPFDKAKIMVGLLRACEKRPVDLKVIEDVTSKVEQKLKVQGIKEVQSSQIGLLIMDFLKEVDLIAYVRFVSVYKEFNNVDSFVKELDALINKD